MKERKVLQKVLSALPYLMLVYPSVQFLLGDLDTLSTILLIIAYVANVPNIILTIIIKVRNYKRYKQFKEGYNYLKALHSARYKLYFSSSDKEKIHSYSEEIQRYGDSLLIVGNYFIDQKVFGKKKISEINKIIDKTKELMQKEFVNN